MIEPMLAKHVLPEFTSSEGFLRRRACFMYGEFGHYKFKENGHIKLAIDGLYQCLYDKELPVRLMAATSINKLMNNDQVIGFLKPALKDLLTVYLKMMTEIDSEELVGALEEIVKHFKDDISPYAVELSA